jgi:hypothetical protein
LGGVEDLLFTKDLGCHHMLQLRAEELMLLKIP